jgi:hypothetical protein
MNEAMQRLRATSDSFESKANLTRDVYAAAARADAAYKVERAKAILRHKASVDRMTQSEAETRADADDEIAALYLQKVVTSADMESLKDKLRQLKEREGSCRTEVTTEREADRIHATRGDRT